MGDQIIVTDEEDKPKAPDVIVIKPQAAKTEKVVTEKTVITETRKED